MATAKNGVMLALCNWKKKDMKKLTLAQAKQIDLVDYLASLGHYPDPKRSNSRDYWYLSPLPGRNEKTPSFKVDRKLNLWFDFGIGEGGSIIDFGIQYHSCTIPELLERLKASFSFQRPYSTALPHAINDVRASGQPSPATPAGEEKKIQVVSTGPITSPALIHYLEQRKIPVELAQAYCREVRYEVRGKEYYAIGFASDTGGYELRNPYFKGSSSPKSSTFFDNGTQQLSVFEGFFSFLSYLTLQQFRPQPAGNYLVLNSLSFFEKRRPLMEQHANITLYLDQDKAGMKFTTQAIKDNSRYKDGSLLYPEHKDFNQWLIENYSRLQYEARTLQRVRELLINSHHQSLRSKGKSHRI